MGEWILQTIEQLELAEDEHPDPGKIGIVKVEGTLVIVRLHKPPGHGTPPPGEHSAAYDCKTI